MNIFFGFLVSSSRKPVPGFENLTILPNLSQNYLTLTKRYIRARDFKQCPKECQGPLIVKYILRFLHVLKLLRVIRLQEQEYFIGINFRGYNLSRFREFFWLSQKFIPAKSLVQWHSRKFVPAKYNFQGSDRNIDQKSRKMASK